MYAQVIVDIAVSEVDRLFTYRVPAGMSVSPGWRVRVPFGPARKEGWVLGLSDTADLPDERIRDIEARLEDYPALPPALIALAKHIAARYGCPMSAALRLMIPAEMRRERVKVKTETVAVAAVPPEALAAYRDGLSKRLLRKRMALTLLMDGEPHSLAELRDLVREPREVVDALQSEGMVRVYERETLRAPHPLPQAGTTAPEPTEDQRDAMEELDQAFARLRRAGQPGAQPLRPSDRRFLLYGVTGSGKTEVYMHAAEACLSAGRGVILLVPEIALTGQMVDWFRARFGDETAILHSRLSAGERYDEWRRIRRGDARLVIGARSAVFAPVENLGAILIDEEHEPSYLNEHSPQYDARDIAAWRADAENALCVMGSATPSIYAFAMARRGDYTLLELRTRANGLPLPDISVVDMRQELRMGNRDIFSAALRDRLVETVESGQQAILFLNRRGYAPGLTCRACGLTVRCSACDVAMTYHRSDDTLRCHYCGQIQPAPRVCPECGSQSIRPVGIGTERVEEEVRRLLPRARTIRMDLDTTRGKDAHYELINAFRSRQAQVLIGTQMIAKGLDFPNVTLVGAVLADLSLNLPDYRSAERTFQLLVQVAGRAGRAGLPGHVIIQTYKPEHYALRAAATQDYRLYFEDEFQRRRAGLYPPFTILARFLIEGRDQQQTMSVANDLKARTEALVKASGHTRRLLTIRADHAPIQFIDGQYRAHTFMKWLAHPDSEALLAQLQPLTAEAPKGCRVTLEINPATLA